MAQGLTSSPLLSVVNGRPIISWVLSNILMQTKGFLTIVINEFDNEMLDFCHKRYVNHTRINICRAENSSTILHSLICGIESLPEEYGPVLINLGDTFLRNATIINQDLVYVADFSFDSKIWCVASITQELEIVQYHNKKGGFYSPEYKAIVGLYELSNLNLLKECLKVSIDEGMIEISDVLEIYHRTQPIVARIVSQDDWIDFGHLEGLAKARSTLIESRSFNNLTIHPILPEITKNSQNNNKIRQEIYWYENLPISLQSIAPRVLSSNVSDESGMLKMEYYGYGTLAEKFIYFDLSDSFWENILSSLFKVIALFKKNTSDVPEKSVSLYNIYQEKTFLRLDHLCSKDELWTRIINFDEIYVNGHLLVGVPKLKAFIENIISELIQSPELSIVHGDLCFGNILYDIATGVIKLIDPRGEFGGNMPCIYGDSRYDVAKLRHSFCGNYDCILEGDFDVTYEGNGTFRFSTHKARQKQRDESFDKLVSNFGYNLFEIQFIEALLFLSMLPLHRDSLEKQFSLFLTGLQKLNECFEKVNG